MVEKYGSSDRLYPKDLVKRALVNSRLHFDSGHLFCHLSTLYGPIHYAKSKKLAEDGVNNVQLQWDIINRFLENSPFVCGEDMTIADFCLVATVTSLIEMVPMDPIAHANIFKWIERMSKLPNYEKNNGAGAREVQSILRAVLQHNQSL